MSFFSLLLLANFEADCRELEANFSTELWVLGLISEEDDSSDSLSLGTESYSIWSLYLKERLAYI